MARDGFVPKEVRGLRGAWTELDQVESRPDRAFLARNTRILPGPRVKTRDGHSVALAVGGKVTGMHQWLTSGLNRLIFYEGTAVKMKDLTSGAAAASLYTLSGRSITVAEGGDRAYISVFATTGLGAGQARFVSPLIAGSPVDVAFMGPFATAANMADNGAGSTTAGSHKFAYIAESRSGFPGKPSPQPADIFTPTSFTVAGGGRTVRMSMTLTVTNAPITIHAIMTRVDNPNKWFYVPGGTALIAVDGAIPVVIDISVSDEDLANRATSADANFNYLSQAVGGTGPFNPSVLRACGNRMVYIVDNKAYVSDPYDFEVVTEDQHAIQMPGQRRIITCWPSGSSIYWAGPGWTYVSSDTGDVPRLWSAPQVVSEKIGTPAPLGVEWRTAGDYQWVASEDGCYLFAGQYTEKPISFLNAPDWRRINWAAAYALQIRDDVKNQTLYVGVPLDAATEISHIFVWNYRTGLEPDLVDFNYDDFGFGNISSLCLVQDATTGKVAMWIGPAAAGNILKQDSTTRSDNGAAFLKQYQTGYLLGGGDKRGRINRFRTLDGYVKGSGSLAMTAYGPDEVSSATIPAATLSASPASEFEAIFDLNADNCSILFEQTGANDWFEIELLRIWHKKYLKNR